MRLLERLNLFWLGAGGFLAFFGADELVAFKLTREPRWLGGNTALAGDIVATLVGLAVMYGLGIREPVEASAASKPEADSPSEDEARAPKTDDLSDPV